MRTHGAAGRFQPAAEINVTPMIDVMLVLLIVCMVLTPWMTGHLPRARTAAPEREDRVTVGVTRWDDRFYVDDHGRVEVVPVERLRARLAAAYAARPNDHVLYLKADRDADYGRVLAVVEAARGAGVWRVGALAELPPGGHRYFD